MNKFKIGDKVKVPKDSVLNYDGRLKASQCTAVVSAKSNKQPYLYVAEPQQYAGYPDAVVVGFFPNKKDSSFNERDLELYEDHTLTIKPGTLVCIPKQKTNPEGDTYEQFISCLENDKYTLPYMIVLEERPDDDDIALGYVQPFHKKNPSSSLFHVDDLVLYDPTPPEIVLANIFHLLHGTGDKSDATANLPVLH